MDRKTDIYIENVILCPTCGLLFLGIEEYNVQKTETLPALKLNPNHTIKKKKKKVCRSCKNPIYSPFYRKTNSETNIRSKKFLKEIKVCLSCEEMTIDSIITHENEFTYKLKISFD